MEEDDKNTENQEGLSKKQVEDLIEKKILEDDVRILNGRIAFPPFHLKVQQ